MASFTDNPDIPFYDVIVVGLGGHGSASLAHIAKSGKKVLGIERFNIAHDKGKLMKPSAILINKIYIKLNNDYFMLYGRFFSWQVQDLSTSILRASFM